MKHTPAPWTIQTDCREYNGDLMIVAMQAGDNGTHVCQVTTNTKRNKINITSEQDANALLIAAAPELLAALITMESYADELQSLTENIKKSNRIFADIKIARAAIAKATACHIDREDGLGV